MGRSFQKNAEAIRRVEADGPVPLAELRIVAGGAGPAKLKNWIIRGIRGVHLDGLQRAADGKWLSSPQAIQRFKKALAALGSQWSTVQEPTATLEA